MYYEKLQVAPRTGPEKVPVYYARDEDWNPVVLKGPLSEDEIQALLETERIKALLGVPRTHVRRDGDLVVSDCLYEYDPADSHVCISGIDKGVRLSNIKLHMWRHDIEDVTTQRSFLKALALRLILGTDDTVPRNFVVIGNTVYSVDDPAWKQEPSRVWKIQTHSKHYNQMLNRHWDWVVAFLKAWKRKKELGEFSLRMCDKYMVRNNWNF